MDIKEKEEIASLTCETLNDITGEIVTLNDLNDDIEYTYKKNMLLREQFGVQRFYKKLQICYKIPFDIEQRVDKDSIKRFYYAKCN